MRLRGRQRRLTLRYTPAKGMTRRYWAISLVSVAILAGVGLVVAREQGDGGVAAARAAADKAFRAGQYADIDAIAEAWPSDEALVVLRARAATARGDYGAAEALLEPIAAASAGSEAALELGLLQRYTGRRTEARRTLQLLLM